MKPKVSIIIPHHNGEEILLHCLQSLFQTDYPDFEVILVDNGSTDRSVIKAKERFEGRLKIVAHQKNLGFAGGCNSGIKVAQEKYAVLLNNDTEVEGGWLKRLVEVAESDSQIAACQPKMLSFKERNRFDYAGAAGGMIDIFGYPFCQGRVFEEIEFDEGQYDKVSPIFWACGTCVLLRKSVLEETGLLDEDFFLHMEEIDLNWRMHLAGYKILFVPTARIYHLSGASLPADDEFKMYLNHRNSLLMLLKNYSSLSLLFLFPVRLILELVAFFTSMKHQTKRSKAIVRALFWFFTHLKLIRKKRYETQKRRKVTDREIMKKMYKGSIAFDHFCRKKKMKTTLFV
ncbi:MAG: glycosyltransferase family 2 protein [Candidatus Edwardsbacteria bacterium]